MKNIFLITLAFFFLSCEYKPEYLGPSLQDQFGPLNISSELRSSMDIFDFQKAYANYFEASWSKNLNWELTLTGQSTGAIKTFSGFGSDLTVYESLWLGTANNFPSFSIEECDVELKLTDLDTTVISTTSVSLGPLALISVNAA